MRGRPFHPETPVGFTEAHALALQEVVGVFDMELWSDAPFPDGPVVRLNLDAAACTTAVSTHRAAKLLAAAIDAADHLDENVTIWLEVTQSKMPPFVAEALDELAGRGAGIMVTHTAPAGIRCSHAPGGQLPLQFRERLARASRVEQVWHPLAQKPVPGIGI